MNLSLMRDVHLVPKYDIFCFEVHITIFMQILICTKQILLLYKHYLIERIELTYWF
jgi:hypothetical protein